MSKIDDLIAKLYPNGVEFKKLSTLGYRNSGTSITAGKMKTIDIEGGSIRIFAGGKTVADVSEDSVPKKDIIRLPSIIVKSRGHIGFIYYDKPFTHKNELWSYTLTDSDINQKFVYYYLLTKVGEFQELARATSVKLPQLSIRDTDNLFIPIPPLSIQQEIVKVLDAFTELEEELEEELEARKKQYSHYRDKLLSFNDNMRWVSWKTMAEIGTFVRGNGLQKKDFTDSGVGCIHYGQIYTYYGTFADKTKSFVSESFAKKMRKAHTGDLVIATTSENNEDVCKAVAWLGEDDIAISGDAYIYRHSLHPKYAAYFFQTEQFEKQKKRHISGTKVKRVSGDSMGKFLIPVPSMEEQERIVSILDKFDTLVTDISEGLPAEIAARHQQYEHYRNRLLTFQEAA